MRLPFPPLRAATLATAALFAVSSCASAPQSGRVETPAPSAANSTTPFISSVSPASGPAGVAYPIELTILGGNFADSSNIVMFGRVTLRAVKSMGGGTRIVVNAPKEMPSTGEVPPMPLMAGSYDVRVTTSAGASNAITFVLRDP